MKESNVVLVCPLCHSCNIRRDALVGWSAQTQSFSVVHSVLDEGSCNDCNECFIRYFKEVDISDYSGWRISMIQAFSGSPRWANFLVKEKTGDWYYVDKIEHVEDLTGSWKEHFPNSHFELVQIDEPASVDWTQSLTEKPIYRKVK